MSGEPADADCIEALQAAPECFGSGLAIALSAEEAAEHGHHMGCLTNRDGFLGESRAVMRDGVERFVFVRSEVDGAGSLGIDAG